MLSLSSFEFSLAIPRREKIGKSIAPKAKRTKHSKRCLRIGSEFTIPDREFDVIDQIPFNSWFGAKLECFTEAIRLFPAHSSYGRSEHSISGIYCNFQELFETFWSRIWIFRCIFEAL
jgi:hypothetical protein